MGEDGTFLIDDQFLLLTDKIIKTIKKAGGDVPKFVINTHFHDDDTSGNKAFAKKLDYCCLQNICNRLQKNTFISGFNNKLSTQPKEGLPIVTLVESLIFHLNDKEKSLKEILGFKPLVPLDPI